MDPVLTSSVLAMDMESPAAEIQDFDSVVRLYWPRIFRFVLASLRDRDAAQTLTQDCFLKAYRGRERFRGEASLHTWLIQIAVNLIRDFGRNRRLQFWRRARSSAVDVSTVGDWIPGREISAEARAVIKQQVEGIWRATERLSERQRTVFLLRFVEDMELLEIAAATGMTEGAVKVHLFRATRSVRERMGKSR
jgi:RNA polymerase sigma-70 factor (ECF subfamily)